MDEYEFDGCEPYENDLEEWGNREAWEDSMAEMAEYDDYADEGYVEPYDPWE